MVGGQAEVARRCGGEAGHWRKVLAVREDIALSRQPAVHIMQRLGACVAIIEQIALKYEPRPNVMGCGRHQHLRQRAGRELHCVHRVLIERGDERPLLHLRHPNTQRQREVHQQRVRVVDLCQYGVLRLVLEILSERKVGPVDGRVGEELVVLLLLATTAPQRAAEAPVQRRHRDVSPVHPEAVQRCVVALSWTWWGLNW